MEPRSWDEAYIPVGVLMDVLTCRKCVDLGHDRWRLCEKHEKEAREG